jgi:DNA helicase-2/ATP-dependent DNA helicase PcrA
MLVTGIETPGWTRPAEFKYQIIGLYLWGSRNARSEEAPLLVSPEAVSILTIHRAKGLEFPVVFVADVCAQRFPSSYATRVDDPLFEGAIRKRIDPRNHADNSNYDAERRLMYVALTRAQRYLFVTSSRPSQFFKTIFGRIAATGGVATDSPVAVPVGLRYLRAAFDEDVRLVTSYSDLRYYLECPHDFYLRKVLGFAPTINQVFGYGRGIHNLLRAIHSDPVAWAELAKNPEALKGKVRKLMERGLFYLRYTTGDPLKNMRERALEIITDYVRTYANELAKLEFEPEREFETLLREEKTLVSGAIDVIRLDDPPRVTLLDFKSGVAESDTSMTLDEEEMTLQVSLYGLAAKRELEYEPELGLVRYLGESDPKKRQLQVELDDPALTKAGTTVAQIARRIRERDFRSGPTRPPRDPSLQSRCLECDFLEICGLEEARKSRSKRGVGRH